MTDLSIDTELLRIIQATHHDPFTVLGRHPDGDGEIIRAFIPGAAAVTLAEGGLPMERVGNSDLFQWRGPAGSVPGRYRLVWRDGTRREHIAHDPYAFPPQLSDYDLHLFGEGNH